MSLFNIDRALRGLTVALPSPRILIGFALTASVLLALVSMQQQVHAHILQSALGLSLRALPDEAPAKQISVVKPVAEPEVPPGPSEFEKESAMSYAELMKRWDPLIKSASKRFGVPASWIRAVMRQESGGRTMLAEGQKMVSRVGAMGLMQLMPDTYADMRRQHKLGHDPFNPEDNINAGAAYLRWLKSRYGLADMFAAYNAGPGTLEQSRAGNTSLPAETRNYVRGISRTLGISDDLQFASASGSHSKKRVVSDAALGRYRKILLTIPKPPAPVTSNLITLNIANSSMRIAGSTTPGGGTSWRVE